tara:strand:+ start:470 stop:973 length:504 start_codon:yes stop_codon:yes gene_type:complete
MKILDDLYESEINFGIDTFYDGGCNVQLGDSTNGIDDLTNTKTVKEAIQWLKQQALKHYPNSTFAKKYKDNGQVQQLRDKGYWVTVVHHRYHPYPNKDEITILPTYELRKEFKTLENVLPHGGYVTVLVEKDGKIHKGKHSFNKRTSYNKKLGVHIALSKALDGIDV